MELLRNQYYHHHKPSELVSQLGSLLGLLTVAHTMLYTLLPMPLRGLLAGLLWRLRDWLSARYHYVEIPELDESTCQPNELYAAIKLHISTCIQGQGHGSSGSGSGSGLASVARSRRLRLSGSGSGFTWSPCNGEAIPDAFDGARLWWEHYTFHDVAATPMLPMAMMPHHHHVFGRHSVGLCGSGSGSGGVGGGAARGAGGGFLPDQERRTYVLKLHRNDKDRVLTPYMDHILAQAAELKLHSRERLLFTNNARSDSYRHTWDSVPFKHPSTFETLAMDPEKKRQIIDDLLAFARGEDFYKKTGRAWKRGYLLHGPPGTGKSSLIAAMANLLRYDVYDLELTQVRSNGELRKLLLRTTSKSIIVIEDIDCSLELGNRIAKPPLSGARGGGGELGLGIGKKPGTRKAGEAVAGASEMVMMMNSIKEEALMMHMQGISGSNSAITLSGLLNFTDGLWSCCGDERIFVFTTNHIESLDPALLRSGRMDMHIFMSYCTFPAFKILASNYLGIEDHPLFASIESAMAQHNMTPAEVSEIFIRNKDKPPHAALQELVSELLSSDSVNSGGMVDGNDEDYDDDSMRDVQELVKQEINPMLSNNNCNDSIVMNGDGEDGLRMSCTDNKLEGSHEAHTINLLKVSSTNRPSSKNGDGSLNCPHCKGANISIEAEGLTELECDDKNNMGGLYVDHSHNDHPCDDKAIVAQTKDGRSSS